jgi:hypothetical protein
MSVDTSQTKINERLLPIQPIVPGISSGSPTPDNVLLWYFYCDHVLITTTTTMQTGTVLLSPPETAFEGFGIFKLVMTFG